jgi:hypothetical protein
VLGLEAAFTPRNPVSVGARFACCRFKGQLLDFKSIQNFSIQQPANICKTTPTIDAALQDVVCHYARLLRTCGRLIIFHIAGLFNLQLRLIHSTPESSLHFAASKIEKRDKTHSSSPAITRTPHLKIPRLHQYGTVYRSHSSATTSAEPT